MGGAGERVGGVGTGTLAGVEDHQPQRIMVVQRHPHGLGADQPAEAGRVLGDQHSVLGVGVEAAMADEVEYVPVVAVAVLLPQRRQGRCLQPFQLDLAGLFQPAEHLVQLGPFLLDVELGEAGIAGTRDHDQDAKRWADRQRPGRIGDLQEADQRGTVRQAHKPVTGLIVEELPGQLGQLRGVGQPQPRAFGGGFAEGCVPGSPARRRGTARDTTGHRRP